MPRPKTLGEVVAEHRDSPSPVLSLDVPLLRLLDGPGCGSLDKKLREVAGEWEVMLAKERLWESLPKSPGIYMFVWRPTFRWHVSARPDSVCYYLYVGQTGAGASGATLRDRYKSYTKYLAGSPDKLWEEPAVRTRTSTFERYLKLEPLEFWYTVVQSPSEVNLLEDQLIKLLMPPLNGQRAPKVRLTTPRPAFSRPSSQGASS